MHFRLISAKI